MKMHLNLTGLVAGLLLTGVMWAQSTSQPIGNATSPGQQAESGSAQSGAEQSQAAGQQALRIAPGSVIPVQLTKSIDSKKAKTGEEVTAKVTEDMKTSTGEVLIPKDTEIIGHVTEAQARKKGEKESDLGLSFDRAVLKNGSNVALPASIQAVIAPPSSANNSGTSSGGAMPASNASGFPAGGNRPGMGGGQQAPANTPPNDEGNSTPKGQQPPITAKTQGIVGIQNYTLSTPSDSKEGSVVSSDKTNVKLESGTLMLLRVNQ